MADNEAQGSTEEPTLQELAAQEAEAQRAAETEAGKKADAARADPGAEDSADGAEDEDDPLYMAKWFDETFGHKESAKHKDDGSFFRSVSEALRKMGRKSDAEALGEKIQSHFADRPDDLLAFLNGKAPSAAGQSEPEAEFDASWVTTDEAGKVVPAPGAPADAMQRWAAHQQKLQRFARNPEKFVREAVAEQLKQLEGLNKQTKQEIEAERQAAQVEAVCQKHRNLLYIEGDPEKGLSPQGQQVQDFCEKYDGQIADPVLLVELACDRALANAPKATSRKVPAKATHKPGVATQPPKEIDEEKFIRESREKGLPFAKIFELLAQRETVEV